MFTIEQEVGIGLAYVHARDRKRLADAKAYQWAKEHWMEFLAQLDTPTGQMLLRAAQQRRRSHQ